MALNDRARGPSRPAFTCEPYNLTKLLYFIVRAIPKDKRLALADNLNESKENWTHDDQEEDYCSATKKKFGETMRDYLSNGIETGRDMGRTVLGIPGAIVGGILGGAAGAIAGFFSSIFG